MRYGIVLVALALSACVPLKQSDGNCPSAPGFSMQGGSCVVDAPSCAKLASNCGANTDTPEGESCCAGSLVREHKSAAYSRSWDQSDSRIQPSDGKEVYGFLDFGTAPASASPFWLDRYEVTVGRFRAFVNDYAAWESSGNPQKGAGAHYKLPSSGWQSLWTGNGDPAPADLAGRLAPNSTCVNTTWTDNPGPNETLPMNCVDWYLAFLFCIWDGGRLPTESEWNFAAAGGSDQRAFPWSDPPSSTDFHAADAIVNQGTAGLQLAPVGSIAGRDGRWGHRDLAGNVVEFVQDACDADQCIYSDPPTLPPYPQDCSDCFSGFTTDPSVVQNRMARGGSWKYTEERARTAYRLVGIDPLNRYDDLGFRCARNPPP